MTLSNDKYLPIDSSKWVNMVEKWAVITKKVQNPSFLDYLSIIPK